MALEKDTVSAKVAAKFDLNNPKHILDLLCHCEGHLERLYKIYGENKDTEALKKVIMPNIEVYSVMVKDLLKILSNMLAASTTVPPEKV